MTEYYRVLPVNLDNLDDRVLPVNLDNLDDRVLP
jgi:hypothetical protein